MKKAIITTENINQFIEVLDGEQWKTAADYPNYLISSYGRCFSLKRRKLLKPILCADKKSKQYYCYRLSSIKGFKWVRVHRLVAKIYIPNPEEKYYVHHKDFNSLNNRWDNLIWVTFSEHMALHHKTARKERNR